LLENASIIRYYLFTFFNLVGARLQRVPLYSVSRRDAFSTRAGLLCFAARRVFNGVPVYSVSRRDAFSTRAALLYFVQSIFLS
jgi:hypothetical protein